MITAFKLFLAPLLIAAATLVGRRWGPAVSGWFIGFPFISAPISIIMAIQNGPDFAGQAAAGTVAGQACVCIFSACYTLAAARLNWPWSSLASVSAFLAFAAVWRSLDLAVIPAFLILAALILLLLGLLPRPGNQRPAAASPRWDLPARMATAAVFVWGLSSLSAAIGPQLSGLFSAFPVFGLILASFTHARQGADAVRQLLRGSILGSFGIGAFYLVLGIALPLTGSLWSYGLAALAALIANGITLQFTRPPKSST